MDDRAATPLDLAELQALFDALPPGQWQQSGQFVDTGDGQGVTAAWALPKEQKYALAAWIIAIHNQWPVLIHDLTTLRARVEAAEAERDNYKAAFDAMRPFVAQIEQTIASAAEQIQQAEAVASEIAAERDRLASALAGVREASQQYKAALVRIRDFGHAPACDMPHVPVYECGCFTESQRDIAAAALPPGGGDTPND